LFARLLASIRLLRPNNMLMIGATALLGFYLGGGEWLSWRALFTALAIALVSGAGYTANDLVDLPIDRLNRPTRPLPSGKITASVAKLQYIIVNLIAVALAAYLGWWELFFIVILIAVCLAYSFWLKLRAPWGNLTVAMLTAASLPFGALSARSLGSWLVIPTLLAFLLNLAREIFKDVEDAGGDRVMQARTLPILLGSRPAMHWGGVLLLIFAGCSLIWYFQGQCSIYYLVIIIPLAAIPAILTALFAFIRPLPAKCGLIQRGIKVLMLVTLVAIIVGYHWR
jgi:geranylgeranylglycerol-phosphate geranylgeranyltransferase